MSVVSLQNIINQVIQHPFNALCGELRALKLRPKTLLAPLTKDPHEYPALCFPSILEHVAYDLHLSRGPTSVTSGTLEPANYCLLLLPPSQSCTIWYNALIQVQGPLGPGLLLPDQFLKSLLPSTEVIGEQHSQR